jgi:hypothetical protein
MQAVTVLLQTRKLRSLVARAPRYGLMSATALLEPGAAPCAMGRRLLRRPPVLMIEVAITVRIAVSSVAAVRSRTATAHQDPEIGLAM